MASMAILGQERGDQNLTQGSPPLPRRRNGAPLTRSSLHPGIGLKRALKPRQLRFDLLGIGEPRQPQIVGAQILEPR